MQFARLKRREGIALLSRVGAGYATKASIIPTLGEEVPLTPLTKSRISWQFRADTTWTVDLRPLLKQCEPPNG